MPTEISTPRVGEPAIGTSAISGEFRDARLEKEFRDAHAPETALHAKFLFGLGIPISLTFLAANLSTLGDVSPWEVVAPRAVAIAASILCLVLVGRVKPAHVSTVILFWQGAVTVTSAMLLSVQQNIAELSVLLLPALFFVAVPVSYRATLVSGSLCGATMLLAYAGFDTFTPKEMKIAVALVLMIALMSLVKGHSGRLLRKAWAAMRLTRQALRDLGESQRALESTFMAVPTPLVVTDLDSGIVTRANEAAARFFKVKSGSLEGRSAKDFYAVPDERPVFTDMVRKLGAVRRFRTTALTAEGSKRSVLLFASRLGSADSARIVTSIVDITEIEEREHRLRSAKEEYETLFENSVVGIYRSTPDGKMLRANPALVRFNGYSSEPELVASVNDISEEWYVQPGRRDEWLALMRTEGRVTDFVSEVYRHNTRERVWISENSWTVWDEKGEPLYFEGTLVEATDRKRAEAEYEYMARHDQLTNLANRRLLTERLEEAALRVAECGGHFAVMCIDLDRFKPVNDAFGHATGDLLLQDVAVRLKAMCRSDDTVARLGGDEFAILLGSVADPADLRETAARVLDELSRPFVLDGPRVIIGASIGIAVAPEDGLDPKVLLACADKALYRAKGDGRNRYRFHDVQFDEPGEPSLRLAAQGFR